jgi:ribonuclease HI
MNPAVPHYLLYTESGEDHHLGRWRFVLRASNGSQRIEASDRELAVRGDRLGLLSVVRALEALDQPSRVTLVDPSDYVRDGMRFGLPEWRRNQWRWEYFGQMVPVRDHDLWRRVDRAMRFHDVTCRRHRVDPAHEKIGKPNMANCAGRPLASGSILAAARTAPLAKFVTWGRRAAAGVQRLKDRLRRWFMSLKPCPRFG